MTLGIHRSAALAAAALLAGLTAACSDAPSAPRPALAPSTAPARALSSTIKSQQLLGDTVITVFVVGTDAKWSASFGIGHSSKIDFPLAAGSICDRATSSYGPGTWDAPCSPSTTAVEITARVWRDAQGFVQSDFQPAMRFVPGLKKGVILTLKDASAAANHRIDFCSPTGCVNEAATDPSVRTSIDGTNGFATRLIKHFSGYNVVVDRSGDSLDGF